jgi:hypothetical protein
MKIVMIILNKIMVIFKKDEWPKYKQTIEDYTNKLN